MFTVLPFGLSTACYLFTKLLRPLVSRWRSLAHVSLVYIDDQLTAKAASSIQRKDLSLSGLKQNEAKSDWQPRQIGQWLGFIIDTLRMSYPVPDKKIASLKKAINDVLNSSCVPLQDITRLAGYLVFMTIVLGPIARLFTRQMYHTIASRRSWAEFKFSVNHVDAFNGYPISRKFSATAIVYSDASDTGFLCPSGQP